MRVCGVTYLAPHAHYWQKPKRARGLAVKDRQEAVADRLDLAARVTGELLTDVAIVLLEQVTPAAVAEVGRSLGRVDDVGEHHRQQSPGEFAPAAHTRQELL